MVIIGHLHKLWKPIVQTQWENLNLISSSRFLDKNDVKIWSFSSTYSLISGSMRKTGKNGLTMGVLLNRIFGDFFRHICGVFVESYSIGKCVI